MQKFVERRGKSNKAYYDAEHLQFARYDKTSQNDFINTMKTQYPKSSTNEIIDIINGGFGGSGIKIKR